MPYWRLFYHVVWATRDRAPLIEADTARIVERSIRTACADQQAILHAVGIMPDHVHVAVSIPPKIAIATFIGRIKGSSSHAVNDSIPANDGPFAWQAEYGVLSLGERALPDVVAYVKNQADRHASHRLWGGLEQTAADS